MSQPPQFLGGDFVDFHTSAALETPADLPLAVARRSLKLARYLVANHEMVTNYFPNATVATAEIEGCEEDHLLVGVTLPDDSDLSFHANEIGGVGVNLVGDTSRAFWTDDLDGNDPMIDFVYGNRCIGLYRGRDLKGRTVGTLWRTATDLLVNLQFVHAELRLGRGEL